MDQKSDGQAQVIAGNGSGNWTFTTFEVVFEKEHKASRTSSPGASSNTIQLGAPVHVHTQAAVLPAVQLWCDPGSADGRNVPLVSFAAVVGATVSPQLGKCSMPTLAMQAGPVDRFGDLRDGAFVLRETDLHINDVFDVPLTRSYRSNDWMHPNHIHAFGRNSNYFFDIAPIGTRNPYTHQFLVLEDGEYLYFDCISKGTGYADAVYMHTETSTSFYKATEQWNGGGWTMKLAMAPRFSSRILQRHQRGARRGHRDTGRKGNRLQLKRDGTRNLQEILTPNGHWIKFTYDGALRVTRAADDAGEWAQYDYNSDGMLANVVLSYRATTALPIRRRIDDADQRRSWAESCSTTGTTTEF